MTVSSYLSIDVSSQHARAWLFENQSGIFQLVSHTVNPFVLTDDRALLSAIEQSIHEIEKNTGMSLLSGSRRFQIEPDQNIPGLRGVGLTTSIVKRSAWFWLAFLRNIRWSHFAGSPVLQYRDRSGNLPAKRTEHFDPVTSIDQHRL
jgi:hypothetical protein